jgi:acyl carrier protein phosphodiesterase
LNYLVHLFLAGPGHEHQLGGLMGDFVKGPIPDDLPRGIAQGLHLHRRIDTFSHTNLHTRRSRNRLDPKYGHGRGIIVDIFYDHFLASSWSEYSPEPLEDFAEHVYTLLQARQHLLPDGLKLVAARMIEQNWLVSYQHFEVVGKALHRISQRLNRPLPLAEATEDLARSEDLLKSDFREFMQEAGLFAREEVASNPF